MQPSRRSLVLLTLLSSVLLPLALPNEFFGAAVKLFGHQPGEALYWGNALLGLVCIAPVFYVVSRAPSFTFAARMGVLFGAVSTALSSFWLMFFQDFSVWTYGGVILGYMGYNALLFPFLLGFSRISGRFRPFLLAVAWCVYEYFKSIGFLAYPWGLVAYPVGNILPLIQFVDVTGVWGLSFLMALLNALVAELALSGWRPLFIRQSAFLLVLVACVFGYGIYRLATPIPHATTATLLLSQQNMNPWTAEGGKEDSLVVNADLTLAGVRASPRPPDLAVWSESSVATVYVNLDKSYYQKQNNLVPAVQRAGVPVLFGGVVIVDLKQEAAWNASVLVDAKGAVQDIYGKIHPVPFAENIPFWSSPAVRWFFRKVVGLWNPWVVGDRYTIYHVPLAAGGQMSFATPICFEDAFSNLCRQFIRRGADMLLNITNDSWSNTWSSEIQHFQVARFRAVENRRVLVRSTNGGVSGVVGPWGEVRMRMPFFERMWKTVDVPIYKENSPTLYTRLGDWFPYALMVLLLAVLIADMIPRKRRLPLESSLP